MNRKPLSDVTPRQADNEEAKVREGLGTPVTSGGSEVGMGEEGSTFK